MKTRSPALLALALGLSSCLTDGEANDLSSSSTFILVDPVDFVDPLACELSAATPDDGGASDGGQPAPAVRRYVATFVDVTLPPADSGVSESPELPLKSSPPVPCNQRVAVGSERGVQVIAEGREYVVRLALYDRSDIEALEPGSPDMVVIGDPQRTVIPPRWRTECCDRTRAIAFATRRIRGCAPLREGGEPQRCVETDAAR